MLTLEKTKHKYYCSSYCGEFDEFESWQDFVDSGSTNKYPEYLLIRYDMYEENPKEGGKCFYLDLYYAGQSEGIIWHSYINNIKSEDLAEINDFLSEAKYQLLEMWNEVD